MINSRLMLSSHSVAAEVTFVVFAPFGGDASLSKYPDGIGRDIRTYPLVDSLARVANMGVNVVALVDLYGDQTTVVEIPAGGQPRFDSLWKLDMTSPLALAMLVKRARERYPQSVLCLAIEGHGLGYMPDLDTSRLSIAPRPGDQPPPTNDDPLPMNDNPLPPPKGEPPPGKRMPISTFGLAWALRRGLEDSSGVAGGAAKLGVIHFNNCFNFAIEVLHTIAPFAEYAVGYPNFNFFTAGRFYPDVFERLQAAGQAPAGELAKWFAQGNQQALHRPGQDDHPTVGCSIKLDRMPGIAAAVDSLANALIDAFPTQRQAIVDAMSSAQRYNTAPPDALKSPDRHIDLRSAAQRLRAAGITSEVTQAAGDLDAALTSIMVYGETGRPWFAEANEVVVWDFGRKDLDLSMSIFLDDPNSPTSDWRLQYYLNVDPGVPSPSQKLPEQVFQIPFLIETRWPEFVRRYSDRPDSLRVPQAPVTFPYFPTFKA